MSEAAPLLPPRAAGRLLADPILVRRVLLGGVLGLGMVARLVQYLFNRSLWLDEAYLALNILRLDFVGLMGPLRDNQVAPPGFLWLEKLAVQLFGDGELMLRLVPLLAGIALTALIYPVARRLLDPEGALIAAALVGWSQPLVYFASEVKPYATDALLALAAYGLYLPLLTERRKISWWEVMGLGAVGALFFWLSYPLAFGLAALGGALILEPLVRRDGADLARRVAMVGGWGIGAGLLYFLVLRHDLGNVFLQDFWREFFPPFPPHSPDDLYWYAQAFFDFLVKGCGLPFYGMAAYCWLAGIAVLVKQGRWSAAVALAGSLAAVMVAAILHKYPFYARTLLFAVPPALILMAVGARATMSALMKDSRVLAALFVGALLFHPFYRTISVLRHPLTTEEPRSALAYVQEHQAPGDRLYVYHGAGPAFEYYAARMGFTAPDCCRVGAVTNGDFPKLAGDVAAMRGGRVWFLFSHIYTYNGMSEQVFLLNTLDGWGSRLETYEVPGATVYLYDLP